MDQVRDDVRASVIQNKIYEKVTADVKVSRQGHRRRTTRRTRQQYVQPASRDVRHILVKKKALADQIYQQVTHGGELRRAREEVLDRPELEGLRRQADDLEGPPGARVRQGRLRAQAARDLEAGEDAVRLAHHRGAHADQEADRDDAVGGQDARSASSSCSRRSRKRCEVGRQHVEGASQTKTYVPGRLRRRRRPRPAPATTTST